MTEIQQHIASIRANIPAGVTLVCVSKFHSNEAIMEAYEVGERDFGESRVQELLPKYEALPKDIRWHFIGHLQTNKIKYLIGKIALYHSCDREDLAQELARVSLEKGLISDILIQINIGEESSKGGYAYEGAEEIFARLSKTQGLRVKGFMAMLPDVDDENLLRSLVQKMRVLFDWAKTQESGIEYLSMGMSGDYKLCIEEGSNVIRLGSTIFGAREYFV